MTCQLISLVLTQIWQSIRCVLPVAGDDVLTDAHKTRGDVALWSRSYLDLDAVTAGRLSGHLASTRIPTSSDGFADFWKTHSRVIQNTARLSSADMDKIAAQNTVWNDTHMLSAGFLVSPQDIKHALAFLNRPLTRKLRGALCVSVWLAQNKQQGMWRSQANRADRPKSQEDGMTTSLSDAFAALEEAAGRQRSEAAAWRWFHDLALAMSADRRMPLPRDMDRLGWHELLLTIDPDRRDLPSTWTATHAIIELLEPAPVAEPAAAPMGIAGPAPAAGASSRHLQQETKAHDATASDTGTSSNNDERGAASESGRESDHDISQEVVSMPELFHADASDDSSRNSE